jgi:hypothetical protein
MTLPANAPLELMLIVGALAWVAREIWPWLQRTYDARAASERQRADEERKQRGDAESKMAQAIDLIGRTLVSIDFNLQEIRRMTEKRFDHVDQRLDVLETGLVQRGHLDRRKLPRVQQWLGAVLGAVLGAALMVWHWGKHREVTS